MTFTFRPAVRENVGLLIGLAGGTGSGKTKSAMRLAAGIAGDKPFAVIDTEAGRAKHYADEFRFDHGDLKPPFRPEHYAEAIRAADDAGYPVIVVDSASHEHAGEGGLLDWQEEELQRMAGDDWKRREACKMAAWIKPKTSHKAFVSRLLQVRAHLILCFRAEEKVEMHRNEKGKMEIVPKQTRSGRDGWVPICEKNLPFEMTCSILLLAEHPGIPNPIKLEEQHRGFFPLDRPISEDAGRAIAAWAAGGTPRAKTGSKSVPADSEMAYLQEQGRIAAAEGQESLRIWFGDLTKQQKTKIKPYLDTELKPLALKAEHAARAPAEAEASETAIHRGTRLLAAIGSAADLEDLRASISDELEAEDERVAWNSACDARLAEFEPA